MLPDCERFASVCGSLPTQQNGGGGPALPPADRVFLGHLKTRVAYTDKT